MEIFKNLQNLLKFKKSSPYFYTIDIGSDSIKVVLSEIKKEDFTLKIIDSIKIAQDENAFHNGKILDEASIVGSLKEAFKNLNLKHPLKVTNCVFSVSAPNSRTIMSTLKVNRSSKAVINEEEHSEIMHKLLDTAYSSLSQFIYEENLQESPSVEMIDAQPVFITCDGRPVLDLEGEEGSEVELCYSVSFAESKFLESISDISKKLGLEILSVIPASVAILNSLKKGKKEKLDGVILNIGASSTEAVVCFGGGIYLNKSLSIGGADITKALSKQLKVPYINAEKIKRLYSLGKLSDKDSAIVQKVILNILNYWLAGVEELFKNFSGVKAFAPEFYLVGGGSDLPDIKEQLFEEPWTKSIPFKSNPEFKKIDVTKLKELELTEDIKASEDLIPLLTAYHYFMSKGMKHE